MPNRINIKLFLATALLLTGFLVSITAFSIVFKKYTQKPYPSAHDIKQEENSKVNFITVGDIMLSRNVARHAEKGGGPLWIWENIADFLHSSDFNFGNLESPTNGTDIYSYQVTMIFNALPKLIRTLSEVNFSVINLANNHALDQGITGIKTTQNLLNNIGIQFIGTGKDNEEAWTAKIIEKNDIKIAFIGASYAAYNDNGNGEEPMIARMQNFQQLKKSIQDAKSKSDFIVISMHGGKEYARETTQLQNDFAHAAIDAGAGMVIGAHPHWTQKIEVYKEKYIFYSLGNFVFDQEFSPETKTGLAIQVFLEKNIGGTSIEKILLHPIMIENYGQPRLMSGEEKIQALRDINQQTDELK